MNDVKSILIYQIEQMKRDIEELQSRRTLTMNVLAQLREGQKP